MTLTELIARVEAGETGRELDVAVLRAAGKTLKQRNYPNNWLMEVERGWQTAPSPTTSIDAQAALPGRVVGVNLDERGTPWRAAALRRDTPTTNWRYADLFVGTAPTEPAARLAALLRAVHEEGR